MKSKNIKYWNTGWVRIGPNRSRAFTFFTFVRPPSLSSMKRDGELPLSKKPNNNSPQYNIPTRPKSPSNVWLNTQCARFASMLRIWMGEEPAS